MGIKTPDKQTYIFYAVHIYTESAITKNDNSNFILARVYKDIINDCTGSGLHKYICSGISTFLVFFKICSLHFSSICMNIWLYIVFYRENRYKLSMKLHKYCIVFFVCLGFIVPLKNFSLIWRRHHYRWRAEMFDLCSAIMAIEQWGFFSMLNLLSDGIR